MLGQTEEARLGDRPNRFLARVELEETGEVAEAFMPNPGRMREFVVPGTTFYVERVEREGRRTGFDVKLVEYGDELVALDSRKTHLLLEEAIEEGRIPEFRGYRVAEREQRLANSVLDLLLTDGDEEVYVEVKSCTLVVDGRGLFPDAPTKRGRRHLRELRSLVESGGRGAVVFIIGRGDAGSLSPNRLTDPGFAEGLERCLAAGVEVLAYRCDVSLEEVRIEGPVEVDVGGEMPWE
ncbi:MAG: Sugar fermentation stimulation protein [Methanonatronarchaeales archaeon]|nr:Sugar fermentation stimulation protein [Methanonatronarchaeales archaeon]